MSEAEQLLARTRLAQRRAAPEWHGVARVGAGAAGAAADALGIPARASAEARVGLSRARQVCDPAQLTPANRLRTLKRVLLRLVRFYTERQAHFNASALRALEEESARLDRVADAAAGLAHETRQRVEELERRLAALEARAGAAPPPAAAFGAALDREP